MKIGRHFLLNGVNWTINEIESKDCGCPTSMGTTSLKESRITLFDINREKTQVENDLCHEVIHAILDSNCINLDDEVVIDEHFVQLMANGVHQFVKAVLEWQREDESKGTVHIITSYPKSPLELLNIQEDPEAIQFFRKVTGRSLHGR
ncbi:MAG: hypothetical protein ABFC34_00600 [Methanobacterium sp.]